MPKGLKDRGKGKPMPATDGKQQNGKPPKSGQK